MSLFIGNLAFGDPFLIEENKIGVLVGSMASALLGVAVLRLCKPGQPDTADDDDAPPIGDL